MKLFCGAAAAGPSTEHARRLSPALRCDARASSRSVGMQFGVALVVTLGIIVALFASWRIWRGARREARARSAKVLDEIEMEFVNDDMEFDDEEFDGRNP